MSKETEKYHIECEAGSPLDQVIEYLESKPGDSMQRSFEDWAIVMHYPYVLYRSGASFEQVMFQANESIRRLNQEITAMKTLINLVTIAEEENQKFFRTLSDNDYMPSHSIAIGKTSEGLSVPKNDSIEEN